MTPLPEVHRHNCFRSFAFLFCFSKIYRVNQIFGQRRFKRIVVSEMDVLKPFFALFSLNFVVLLSWTLVRLE